MTLTVRFESAYDFAAELHRDQKRKETPAPYISHLLAVAALVLEDGGVEEEAMAVLLHDAIEDQGDDYPGGRDGLRGEIALRFGRNVLDIVNACTDDEGFTKHAAETAADEAALWRLRKRRHIAHIPRLNDRARRVSCADKLHTALCIWADYLRVGNELWSRFRTQNGADQVWYYHELARAFDRDSRLETQFRAVVEMILSRYARLSGAATVV